MCMFSLGDFLYLFFIIFLLGAGGMCGLLLKGVGVDRSHAWATLRLRLRLGIVLGGVYSNLNVFGACLIHIS